MKRSQPEIRVTRNAWGDRVEAWAEGKAVSRIMISRQVIRVGVARLRMAGVGGVWTDKAWRGRGLARRCMDAALPLMRENGSHISMLFGIRDFYHRWGYASVMAEPRAVIRTDIARHAARRLPGWTLALYRPARDLRRALALDARMHGGRPGTQDRTGAPAWQLFRLGSDWGIRARMMVARDPGGVMQGYIVLDRAKDRVGVVELAASSRRVLPLLIRVAVDRSRARRADEITWFLPADHPAVEYLRHWNVAVTTDYYEGAHGMGRIVDLAGTLRAVEPELTRRWRASGFVRSRLTLTITTELGSFTLRAAGGRVRMTDSRSVRNRVKLPQWLLLQLLLGYRSVEDATTVPGARLPAATLAPLCALFPSGFPYLWKTGRF